MKKILFATVLMFVVLSGYAQDKWYDFKPSKYSKPSRDYTMLQIGYENWLNRPDSIPITGVGRALNAYVCYDFPIQKSNFSFAAGAGIGISNVYFKNQSIILTDTVGYIKFIPEPINYKKYKLTTTYLEAPFELRYYSDNVDRNKGIKAAIGLKVGALVSSHTKSKRTVSNKPVVEKVSTKRYIESYRYSLTGRLGYGNFSVYAQYSLSNLFKVNAGPENVKTYQIGLCISGL